MSRPDEGLIHAWLDGELPAEEAARVERLVAEDAEWGAAAAEARGLVAASSRILRALDHVPGDVIPAGGNRAPVRRSFASRTWVRIAAGVVFVAGVSVAVSTDGAREPVPGIALNDEVAPMVAAESIDVPAISAPRDARVEAPRERTTASAERAIRQPSPAPTPPPPPSMREPVPAPLAADVAVTSAPTVAGAAADVAERARLDARRGAAELEQRSAASRLERREASANAAQGFAAAAKALSVQALDGCWRVTSAAGADSLLATPRVLRADGDTLVVDAGVTARPARVVRIGEDALRGEMADENGRRVPFAATRVGCPVPPTPAPRR